MNTIDRIMITILFMGAILRPTEVSWIYVFSIVVVYLLWEVMIIVFYYGRKPVLRECVK